MKYLLPLLLLCSCGQEYTISHKDDGIIKKQGPVSGAVGEMTPILLNNNIYIISFDENSSNQGFIQVQKYPSLEVFSRFTFPYNFGSAIVVSGVVHVFASSNTMNGPGNFMVMTTSTDLVNWLTPTTILVAPSNRTFYNSSVAKTDAGYVLAYEIHEENNQAWFYARFLFSTDLVNWTPVGDKYDPTAENACPTIRYSDGYYYLFTLKDRGSVINNSRYYTTVARSTDLVNFEESPVEVLNSSWRTDEGINNSDIDMLEYNGQMLFVYLVGDQQTFGFFKFGYYTNNFDIFIKEFFK